MTVGILYNIFVCSITGMVGLVVFAQLQGIRKRKGAEYSQGIDYFLLLLGILWVFVGIRLILAGTGMIELELFVYKWIVGPLTYFHLLPAFYYFGSVFFKEKKFRDLFISFFVLTTLLAVFFLFRDGFFRPQPTYWGNNIKPNKLSNIIFNVTIFLPAIPFIVFEIFRRIKEVKKRKEARQLLGFAFSFLVYAAAGFFEAIVFTQGPLMLLARTGIMVSLFCFSTFQLPLVQRSYTRELFNNAKKY